MKIEEKYDVIVVGGGHAGCEAALAAAGFGPVDDRRDGDVALMAVAAGQFHLGVMGPASFVHAHAGLRRVVETPLDEAMQSTRWRLGPPRCD